MFEYLEGGRLARSRRGRRRGVAYSVLFHALVLAALLAAGNRLDAVLVGRGNLEGFGTGPTAGPAGGGGGGAAESVTYVELTPAPAPADPEPTPPPPPPDPVPVPPEALPPPKPPPPAAEEAPKLAGTPVPAAGAAGQGTGAGEGTGPGTGPGSGGGSGGGAGGGIGSGTGPGTGGGAGDSGIRPPTPVSVILPPTPPPSARGKTVVLRLTVNERGEVKQVAVTTPTGDRGFDNRLRRTASDWRFNPARQPDGRPVAAQVDISFSF